MSRIRITCIAIVALVSSAASAQENPTTYYRYPVSVGFSYLPLRPLSADATAQSNEFAGTVRLPIGGGLVHLLARGGVQQYDSQDPDRPARWDHRLTFGGIGAGLGARMSKEIEVGLDGYLAGGQSVYPNLAGDLDFGDQATGSVDLLGGVNGKLTLNPSFNLSIDIQPGLQYRYNLGGQLAGYPELSRFDGFSFGIGVAAHYRFGRDPDSPEASVRALRLSQTEMPPVFAAMQSVYVQQPLTEVTLENTERGRVEDLQVFFFQNGYMDSPTPSAELAELNPGEQVQVPLHASYNRAVFETNGITPLTGEIIVQYSYNGRPEEQRFSVTYDLHDRNALTWSDDRKVAAFVTPSDSALRNYASYVRTSLNEQTNEFVSEPLQFAMQTYNALAAQGLVYQPDPASPFTQVQDNPQIVDSISLPRETLRRITGDCDDITVLFNTLLETSGYETALVTIPGHIYSAVNTGVAASDIDLVHPSRDMSLVIDGEVWVLIEITLIGQTNFLEAWATGMRQWREYDEQADVRGFYRTREAQQVFRPVGLVETDLGLQYAEPTTIQESFIADFQRLSTILLQPYAERTRERNDARTWNRYGIRAAMLDNTQTAREAFRTAARLDQDDLDPLVNLGSVEFLNESYGRALEAFEQAATRMEQARRVRRSTELTVYINLAKTHYRLESFEEAESFYALAQEIDSDAVAGFAYIGSGSSQGGRASDAASGPPILFADSDD